MKQPAQTANNPKKILHLCDFDGTLTRGDSLLRFLWFAVPPLPLMRGIVTLIFVFSRIILSGKWTNSSGKMALMGHFFIGKTESEMRRLGQEFCQQKLPGLLREALMVGLRRARQNGETIAVVSASFDIWLEPFCQSEGFDLLCTQLEFVTNLENGIHFGNEPRFSGRFANTNCNRAEKARRILEAFRLENYEKIIAYGNARGDAEMFALADEVIKF